MADEAGTSFAAGRMSYMLVCGRVWLLQVLANMDRLRGAPFGVPLVGSIVIDRFGDDPPAAPPQFDWPALPVVETIGEAFAGASAEQLDLVRTALLPPHGHNTTRRLVQLAAAATTPADVTLSAPSLTLERLNAVLDTLTARDLLSIVLEGRLVVDRAGAGRPLFAPGSGDLMQRLIGTVQPRWDWDIDRAEPRIRKRKGTNQ